LLKLARGHASYELGEHMLDEPNIVEFCPIHLLGGEERVRFESSPIDGPLAPWPEVGSRAMQRLVSGDDLVNGWVVVQAFRYRYQATFAGSVHIRMVLRDYLAAEVVWDP